MPGRLILNSPISAVFAALPNIPPYCGNEPARHNIQPGQDILVATRQGFQKMRWGIIPVGRVNARGRPVMETIIKPVLPAELITSATKFFINPTGRFVIGGPMGDCGLTGRKIIVDTYGGMARHGGGAFSGKDPSKVDRSAAYAARYVAKNVVAAGLADKCELQVSYAIGVAEPTSISVETFGTGKLEEARLIELIREHFDLRPYGLIQMLDLERPIYLPTAAYGHFGRDEFPWERTDKADALRAAAGL